MKPLSILAALALVAAPASALASEPSAKAGAPNSAASSSSAAKAAASPAAQDQERLICRRDYGTGSRTQSVKTCLTKTQWRAYDRGGEEGLRRELDRTR